MRHFILTSTRKKGKKKIIKLPEMTKKLLIIKLFYPDIFYQEDFVIYLIIERLFQAICAYQGEKNCNEERKL